MFENEMRGSEVAHNEVPGELLLLHYQMRIARIYVGSTVQYIYFHTKNRATVI